MDEKERLELENKELKKQVGVLRNRIGYCLLTITFLAAAIVVLLD